MLNNYLRIQANVIHKHQGTIDKYVGDEVMALFEGTKMIENAINAAIEIQRKAHQIRKVRKDNINIGIGINAGEVVMGNMGSQDRMDHTVIGDSVNIAARLCGIARPGDIFVTASTSRFVKNKYKIRKIYKANVKGKSSALQIIDVAY